MNSTRISTHCYLIQRGDEFVLALTPEGNDAARLTVADLQVLGDALDTVPEGVFS